MNLPKNIISVTLFFDLASWSEEKQVSVEQVSDKDIRRDPELTFNYLQGF